MRDTYEAAIEQWIDAFISDNDREPTDDEIEAASDKAIEDYIASKGDSAYERMREEAWDI